MPIKGNFFIKKSVSASSVIQLEPLSTLLPATIATKNVSGISKWILKYLFIVFTVFNNFVQQIAQLILLSRQELSSKQIELLILI